MTKTFPRRGQAKNADADPGMRPGRPLSTEDQQRIIQAYTGGVSIHGIVGTFGYSRNAVRKVLRTSGDVQLRNDGEKPKMSREVLLQRHQEGWTPRQIADACGANITTVHQRLASLGLQIAPKIPDLPLAQIAAAHEAGQSMAAIARKYGVARETIARRLAKIGRTPAKPAPVVSVLKLTDMCRRGMTTEQMSRTTGIGPKTLRKHLAAAGMRAADNRPGRERPAIVPKGFGRQQP